MKAIRKKPGCAPEADFLMNHLREDNNGNQSAD